ncbi:MAG TPA: hypothetical protein VGK59_23360 [Ohtaekwangia sp.]
MRKNFLLVVAMMMSTVIFAQHHKGDGRRHDPSEKMKTVLSLDDNQYATIKSINKKYDEKRTSLRMDTLQSREAKHVAVKSLHRERQQEIDAVLTPEQKTTWKNYKTEQAKKQKEERQKSIEKHQAEMKAALSLSDEQAAKMKAAGDDFKSKRHAAKKDGQRDKAEFRKLKEEHKAVVKSILTEEQFQKWTSLQAEKRKHHKEKNRHK